MTDLPQWAMEKARTLSDDTLVHGYTRGVLDIALALVEAEARGIERAAKVVAPYTIEPDPDEFDPFDDWGMGGRTIARQIEYDVISLKLMEQNE